MTAVVDETTTTLPVEQVRVTEGFNPRTTEDEAAFAELVNSVALHGIIQPILVQRFPEEDAWDLVAGHRRLAAAKECGLSTVPVRIVEGLDREEATGLALVENIQRADLTPAEEAVAFAGLLEGGWKKKQIAASVGRTTEYVTDRLRLLKVPESVRGHLGNEVPLAAVAFLELVAETSPAIAAKAVEYVLDPDSEHVVRDLIENPEDVLGALGWWDDDKGALPEPFIAYTGTDLSRYAWAELDDPRAKEIESLLGQLPGYTYPRFSNEDVDAMVAYGGTIVLEDKWQRRNVFTTDVDHFFEMARKRIVEYVSEQATRKGASPAQVAKVADPDATPAEREEAAKVAAVEERTKAKEEMLAARNANLELGRKLLKKFAAPKLTKENVKLLVGLLVQHSGYSNLAFRGLRLTEEGWQEEEVRKNGSVKVTYLGRGEAEARLTEMVEKAKTPEEALGVVLRAIIAASYADEGAVPKSQASFWNVPYYGTDGLREVVEKIAAACLPERMKGEKPGRDLY